jgi:thioesterase domain-containing protein
MPGSRRRWVSRCRMMHNRPVYGLHPPPLDGIHRIFGTIESMATDYIAEIRRLQPRGPYFLMGYSLGGWVAFEMAQQLVRQGEHVSFLGLVDTILRKPPMLSRAALLRREVRRKVQGLRARQAPIYVIALRAYKRAAFGMRSYNRYAARWLSALNQLFNRTMSHTQRSNYYDWLSVRAKRHYAPQPYPGRLTFFASIDNLEWQRRCWTPLVQGALTVVEVPAATMRCVHVIANFWRRKSMIASSAADEWLDVSTETRCVRPQSEHVDPLFRTEGE